MAPESEKSINQSGQCLKSISPLYDILACLSGEMSFTLARVWNSSSEESSPPVSVSTSFKVWNSSRSVLVMERTLCSVWNWSSDSESESTVLSVTERRGRVKSDLTKETDSGESVETQEEKQLSAKDFQSA